MFQTVARRHADRHNQLWKRVMRDNVDSHCQSALNLAEIASLQMGENILNDRRVFDEDAYGED